MSILSTALRVKRSFYSAVEISFVYLKMCKTFSVNKSHVEETADKSFAAAEQATIQLVCFTHADCR